MIKQEEVFKIGKLGKSHGVKGEVNLLFDDDIFDRTDAEYLILEVDGILVPFYIEEYRFHGNSTALMKFCEQKEILIPASEDLIQGIDTEREEVKIQLPEGILDL